MPNARFAMNCQAIQKSGARREAHRTRSGIPRVAYPQGAKRAVLGGKFLVTINPLSEGFHSNNNYPLHVHIPGSIVFHTVAVLLPLHVSIQEAGCVRCTLNLQSTFLKARNKI